ncbi:Cyclin-B1-2 [Smittium mucronatum]|uniref:Cyclin-B1-2 n=1 Tax=Smittium mucronatum TaxID=133383 RepID=A0A1R0GRM3_9FUNG|nr:Cyclin-B1-2 [Smittium mucronatum]
MSHHLKSVPFMAVDNLDCAARPRYPEQRSISVSQLINLPFLNACSIPSHLPVPPQSGSSSLAIKYPTPDPNTRSFIDFIKSTHLQKSFPTHHLTISSSNPLSLLSESSKQTPIADPLDLLIINNNHNTNYTSDSSYSQCIPNNNYLEASRSYSLHYPNDKNLLSCSTSIPSLLPLPELSRDESSFSKHLLSEAIYPPQKRSKFDKHFLNVPSINQCPAPSQPLSSHPCNLKTLLSGPPQPTLDHFNCPPIKRKTSGLSSLSFNEDSRVFKKNKLQSLDYSDVTVIDELIDSDSASSLISSQNFAIRLPSSSQKTAVSSPYLLSDGDSLKSSFSFDSIQLLSENFAANLETESNCVNLRKYCHLHPKLNKRMRAILVDWLMEVANDYRLHRHTLHLSIYLLDKLLLFKSLVPTNLLQCYGAACLLVAIKAEENRSVKISEITRIAMGAFTTSQLKSAEIDVLNACKWHLTVPTIPTFIGIFSNNDPKLFEAACDIADIVSHDYDFVGSKYSSLAMACCIVACSKLRISGQACFNIALLNNQSVGNCSSLVADIQNLLGNLEVDFDKFVMSRQLVECQNYDHWSYQPYHPNLLNMFQQFFRKKTSVYSS